MKKIKPLLMSFAFVAATFSLGSMASCNQDSNDTAKAAPVNATTPSGAPKAAPANALTTADNPLKGLSMVDRATIFSRSDSGKAAVVYLKGISDSLNKELADYRATVKGTDAAAQKRIQRKYNWLQTRFQAEEQQVNNALEQLYQSSLGTVMTAEQIQIVFDKSVAQAYRNQLDISQKVLDEMNKTKLTFTPLPAPAEEPEEVKEAPKTEPKPAPKDAAGGNNNKKPVQQQNNNNKKR